MSIAAEIIEIPVIILARDSGHQIGRKLTRKRATQITDNPRGKRQKSTIHARKSAPKHGVNSSSYWNSLTRRQQELYIKQHPKTKRKVTKKLAARPTKRAVAGKGGNKSKRTAQQNARLIARSKRTVNPRQFAKAVAARSAGRKSKSAAVNNALDQANTLAQNPPTNATPNNPANPAEAMAATFGHLADVSSNQIIQHVNKSLSDKDKATLGQALQHAQDHPNDEVPQRFRRALGRTLLFALTVGVGGALLGPAGILLATDHLNSIGNKSNDNLAKFAYKALSGKKLNSQNDDKAAGDDQEQAVAMIIKHLKEQLALTQDEQLKTHYKSLIDQLDDGTEHYNKYLKPA